MDAFVNWWNSIDTYALYMWTSVAIIPAFLIAMYASVKVNSTFAKYKHVENALGLTGREVASRMLADAGITDVRIEHTSGNLTDHYDPRAKVLRLSDSTYASRSVSAIGVAAHEVGHAIQHSRGYVWIKVRGFLVPVINVVSKALWPLLMIGMLLSFLTMFSAIGNFVVLCSVILFGLNTLFSLVTLPTEFNASSRAKKILADGILSDDEVAITGKVLSAAAMTYVASFIMSALQFLRFVAMFLMRRNRNN